MIAACPNDIRSSLNIIFWNVRSAMNKMSEIVQYASDNSANITLLNETWQPCSLTGKYDCFSAAIKDLASAENYNVNCFSCPRSSGGRGGGVATLSDTSLNVKRLSTHKHYITFESLFVIVKHSSLKFILGNIYRPPNTFSFQEFLDEFSDLLELLSYEKHPVILAGDFNVQMNLPRDPNSSSFSSLVSEFNLSTVLPDSPTHCLGNVLDFAIVSPSLLSSLTSSSVDSSDSLSDHFPVMLSLASVSSTSSQQKSSRNRRIYNKLDHESFSSDLSLALDSIDTSTSNLKDYLHDFNSAITNTLDTFAPIQPTISLENPRPPWLDQEYVQARALRRRYEKLGDKVAYNQQKKVCARLVCQKKTSYFSSLFTDLTLTCTNQRQLFKTFNKLFDRNKHTPTLPPHNDSSTLADDFNLFFLNKVSNIRSCLPSSTSHTYLEHNSPASDSLPCQLSSFDPTTTDELLSLIHKHGIKTSSNDPLPDFLLDENLELFLPHLCNLVNLSLSTCSFDGLKEAHVVPILKSLQLDSDLFNSYRPVSLLSFVSKLTERVVHTRVNDYLSSNNLHVPSQFGYKRNHSCETFLLKLIDDILVKVDRKLGVVVLILDLSAAFDTVDHKVLLNILQHKFHITGSALSWFKAFLSGRTQCVKIGDSFSSFLPVLFGVPQGSILGPLLFNLYCSSLPDVFSNAGFDSMGYADDNLGFRVFPAYSKLSTLFSDVPSCLSSISKWTNTHFLKLNESKTNVMVFGNKSFKQSLNLSCCLDSSSTLRPLSHSTKLLGAHIDDALSFDVHVSKTVSSSLLFLKNARSIRKYLTVEAASTLIHSVITSKLDQCNSLFFEISSSNLTKLQRIQNFALRTVLNLPSRSHISHRFQDLHWLTVDQRIHFKLLTITFKCIHCLAPSPLATKINISCPLDMLLDSSRFYPSSTLGKKAFSYSAPRCWNALPRSLRIIPTLDTFKSQLKHFLFTNFTSYLHNLNPYS